MTRLARVWFFISGAPAPPENSTFRRPRVNGPLHHSKSSWLRAADSSVESTPSTEHSSLLCMHDVCRLQCVLPPPACFGHAGDPRSYPVLAAEQRELQRRAHRTCCALAAVCWRTQSSPAIRDPCAGPSNHSFFLCIVHDLILYPAVLGLRQLYSDWWVLGLLWKSLILWIASPGPYL